MLHDAVSNKWKCPLLMVGETGAEDRILKQAIYASLRLEVLIAGVALYQQPAPAIVPAMIGWGLIVFMLALAGSTILVPSWKPRST
jgi:hypothetical protein